MSAGPKFTTWSIDDLLSYAHRRFPAPVIHDTALGEFKEFAPLPNEDPTGAIEKMKHKDLRNLPRINSVAVAAGFHGKYPYADELAAYPYPRVNAYGFRGESRPPADIKHAGGFLPNYTRPEHIAKHEEKVKDAMKGNKFNIEALRKLAEDAVGALNLRSFLQDQFLKGFISTTKSIAIAKHFATSKWVNGAPREGQVDGWVYACLVFGAFDLPPGGDDLPYNEQEMTVPGMIDWENVVACRQVKNEGFFLGPVYMRRSLVSSDVQAARTIWELLSEKRQ
jgi:hypothetical protein